MNPLEESRAVHEAQRGVVTRAGGGTSHEHALQQYLVAAQYGVTRGDRPQPDAAAPPAAPPAAQTVADESSDRTDRRSEYPAGAVVVGVDDSAGARAAAAWGADEAVRRHAPLVLVHAYRLPATGGFPGYNPVPDDLLEQLRAAGDHLLRRIGEEVAGRHPDLPVVRSLVHGRAEVALREASGQARLTVVGNAPSSRVAGALLGSVALAVTSSNPVPVAVVHAGHQVADGPIVVGVDGSPLSEAAVAFAFDEAALRGVELVAVHAWNDVYLDSRRLEPLLIDPQTLLEQERALLGERLAGWGEKYPDVPVRQVLLHQRPVQALLGYADSAGAMVVGSHGRGGFAGMLLGSTGHALATHGQCPVIVVRNAVDRAR